MNEEKSSILVAMSRVLGYPDHSFFNDRTDVEESIEHCVTSKTAQKKIAEAVRSIYELKWIELQELYVETFDYKEKTSLYLTSHELGDSRNRGTALIQLQEMIKNSGYERTGQELADYIPMLLEYLAATPVSEQSKQLERRLACATHRILSSMDEGNLYANIFEILREYIFESPSEQEIADYVKERETADLEPLPYPIMYQ